MVRFCPDPPFIDPKVMFDTLKFNTDFYPFCITTRRAKITILKVLFFVLSKQARSQTIETGGAHTYEEKLAPNHGWTPEKNLNLRSSKMP